MHPMDQKGMSRIRNKNCFMGLPIKIYEAISSRLSRELVSHDLDGNDPVLAHLHHGTRQEILVHVRLEAPNPKGSNSCHLEDRAELRS